MRAFLIFVIIHPIIVLGSEVAVSYELNDGRFGDQLLCYLHAKWISYFYGVPLLYKPFLYSEQFMLHEKEDRLWTEEKEGSFDCIVRYIKGTIQYPLHGSLLYLTTFFSEQPDDAIIHPFWNSFFVNWEDPGFIHLLKSLFIPKKSFFPPFPKGKDDLTVAIHIRRGGDFDPQDPHMIWPLRFVPDSYYIECLRKICALFPDRRIYAFLFTDDPDPQLLADKYQHMLYGLPITFDFRREGNRHDANVIEDFVAMMQFDCLIRSRSNFSLIPSIIAEYKVVMTPKHFIFLTDGYSVLENYIDQIDVDIRQ